MHILTMVQIFKMFLLRVWRSGCAAHVWVSEDDLPCKVSSFAIWHLHRFFELGDTCLKAERHLTAVHDLNVQSYIKFTN